MHLNFQEVRNELLMKKDERAATFQNVYEGTHIAYSMSRNGLFFAAFDSNYLHILYMQNDNRRIEETFAGIECPQNIIDSIREFERRKGIYPTFHFFFTERPCFESYIQYSSRTTCSALENLPRVMYTPQDIEFFLFITKDL